MKKRIFKKKHGLLLESVVVATVNYVVSEIEIYSVKTGFLVGYWAYGYYHPELDYKGQDYAKFINVV